jgi:hypothetical protein
VALGPRQKSRRWWARSRLLGLFRGACCATERKLHLGLHQANRNLSVHLNVLNDQFCGHTAHPWSRTARLKSRDAVRAVPKFNRLPARPLSLRNLALTEEIARGLLDRRRGGARRTLCRRPHPCRLEVRSHIGAGLPASLADEPRLNIRQPHDPGRTAA